MATINTQQLQNLYQSHVEKTSKFLKMGLFLTAYDFHSRALAVGDILKSLGAAPPKYGELEWAIDMERPGNEEEEKKRRYSKFVEDVNEWGEDCKKLFITTQELSLKNSPQEHKHKFEFISVKTLAVSGGCSPIKVATVICTTCGMVAETPIKTY